MDIGPVGSMAVGCIAGCWSVFGYAILSPFLERRFGLHDTCGIHNLHGMPGLLGGISSMFAIGLDRATLLGVKHEDTAQQVMKQLWGMAASVFFGIVGGYLTGLVIKEPVFDTPEDDFEDKCFWEVAGEDEGEDMP